MGSGWPACEGGGVDDGGSRGAGVSEGHAKGALKQRILGYRTPPYHRRPVTAHECLAAPQHRSCSYLCSSM